MAAGSEFVAADSKFVAADSSFVAAEAGSGNLPDFFLRYPDCGIGQSLEMAWVEVRWACPKVCVSGF